MKHRWHGFRWGRCGECREPYEAVQLFYPVWQKNYQADGFVADQWETLRAFMKHAYWITIFGYSAPATDVEALQLLNDMATENSLRAWGDVEIIDIKEQHELHEKWKPLFVRGHYSLLSRFARQHPLKVSAAFDRDAMVPHYVAPTADTASVSDNQ